MYYGDLSDEEWALIAPMLPPQKPRTGRPAHDHRSIMNAILWVKRNGYAWRLLPREFGCWSTVASRYHRWCKTAVWQRVQAALDQHALVSESATNVSRREVITP